MCVGGYGRAASGAHLASHCLPVPPLAAGLRVVGFEPIPTNIKVAAETACANAATVVPRFKLIPSAAGAATVPGGVDIFVPHRGDNAAMSSKAGAAGAVAACSGGGDALQSSAPPSLPSLTLLGLAASANVGGATEAVHVPLVALDDWFAPFIGEGGEYDPAFLVWLKLDVQGYESHVLKGAEKLIKAATNPAFRITAEDDHKLYSKIEGAVSASELLKSWGFVAHNMEHQPDPTWVNPKYFKA